MLTRGGRGRSASRGRARVVKSLTPMKLGFRPQLPFILSLFIRLLPVRLQFNRKKFQRKVACFIEPSPQEIILTFPAMFIKSARKLIRF